MASYKNTLLISPDYVKGVTLVDYNVSDAVIAASIADAQRNYLPEIMPGCLVDKLLELVYLKVTGVDGGISAEGNEAFASLLEEAVQPYLADKVQAIICRKLSQKIRNAGVVANSDTNMTPVSGADMTALVRDFETAACASATRLSTYVEDNAETLGVEHYHATIWVNSPVYLGNSRRGGRRCNG